MESGQTVSIAGGAATPPQPEPTDDKPTSPDVSVLVQELAELKAQLRGLQGDKDRAVVRNQKRIDDLEQTIQQYAQYAGVEVGPKAIRDMRIDQLLQGKQTPAPQAAPSQASGGEPQGVQLSAIFDALSLDANSPEVVQVMAKSGDDTATLLQNLVSLKAKQLAKPPASPAGLAPPTGSVTQPDNAARIEQVTAELQQLQRTPTLNVARRKELAAELRKLTS
jgi:hypothetical protein